MDHTHSGNGGPQYASCYEYDYALDAWTVAPPLTLARTQARMLWFNGECLRLEQLLKNHIAGQIFIFGGNVGGTAIDVVEVRLANGTWAVYPYKLFGKEVAFQAAALE